MDQHLFENRPAALRRPSRSGQSMLEMAVLLPILLLLIAGVVEIGAYANDYLTLLNAAREGARFGVDLDPSLTVQEPFDTREGHPPFPDVRYLSPRDLYDRCDEGKTVNFYYEVACLTFQNIPLGQLTTTTSISDDIVITVVGFNKDGTIAYRWPLPEHRNDDDWEYHFKQSPNCWSLYGAHDSSFDDEWIQSELVGILNKLGLGDAEAGGLVIVEVFRAHPHFTGVFAIGDFIPDPVPIHTYAVFPLPAATPR